MTKINPEAKASFEDAAKPLIKWLNENTNPHIKVIVDCDSAELFSGEMRFVTTEFILD